MKNIFKSIKSIVSIGKEKEAAEPQVKEVLKMSKKTKFEIPESVKLELEERDKSSSVKKKGSEPVAIQLPLSPESTRALPTNMARSSLFGVVKRGERPYLKDMFIVSWSNVQITYTGQKLAQSDQDVWLAVIELCKRSGSSLAITTKRELLRLSGRKGSDTKRLWGDLQRLVATAVEVHSQNKRYMGSLVDEAILDEDTGKVCVRINPRVTSLFIDDSTWVNLEQRHALKYDLSKWLQGYICSHKATVKKPHLISTVKLQGLCGSHNKQMAGFKRKVRESMVELENEGVVLGWELEKDVLSFWRK